jgi:hypothetical protein
MKKLIYPRQFVMPFKPHGNTILPLKLSVSLAIIEGKIISAL